MSSGKIEQGFPPPYSKPRRFSIMVRPHARHGFCLVPALLLAACAASVSAQDFATPLNIGDRPIADQMMPPIIAVDQQPTGSEAQQPQAEKPQAEKDAAPKSTEPCKTCCHGTLLDWSKYPATIRPMSRPGIFSIPPPPGPAYYSMWDAITGECRKAPPKSGYPPNAIMPWAFYDADWRFVEGVPCQDRTFVERMKRIHLGDCWLLSTGGEYWLRYHNEHNARLSEAEATFTFQHLRTYADLWYKDSLRIYGEFVWADLFNENIAPLPPDVDRGDINSLFVDLKLFDYQGKPVFVRGGRQEFQYGSQRFVTPLPWANKRNTFQGIKLFRQSEKWDFDAFWGQFVPPVANEFDSADENINLAGLWLTQKPQKGEAIDYYYLLLDNENSTAPQGVVRTPTQAHTLGSRWSGDRCGNLWDVEGAVQFGEVDSRDLLAGMFTAGLGRNWKDASMSPTAWLYYDYASGDADPNVGTANTLNSIFPFGHYYLGWADLVGRQNIHDVNAHLYLYPAPWMMVWLQYHHFWLAEPADSLYTPAGVGYRRDATGQSGTDVGDEIDLVFNFHLTRYSDFLVSYNMFFGGEFLENTAGPNAAIDSSALYMLFQQRW
jgi:hypothetical protein